MMPGDANNMGHVFGGVIMAMMDKTAAIAAYRHCRAPVVTASVDRVDFREPIHLGDLVVMKASVNYVGKTSMEVGVRVEAEELLTAALASRVLGPYRSGARAARSTRPPRAAP